MSDAARLLAGFEGLSRVLDELETSASGNGPGLQAPDVVGTVAAFDARALRELVALLRMPGVEVTATAEGKIALRLPDGGLVTLPSADILVAALKSTSGAQGEADNADRQEFNDSLAWREGVRLVASGGETAEAKPDDAQEAKEATGDDAPHVGGGSSFQRGQYAARPLGGGIGGSQALGDETSRWGRDDLKRGEIGERGPRIIVGTGASIDHLIGLGDEESGHRNGEKLISGDNAVIDVASAGVGSGIGHLGGLGNTEYTRSSGDDDEQGIFANESPATPQALSAPVIPPLIRGPLIFSSTEDTVFDGRLFSPTMLHKPITDIVISIDPAAGTLVLNPDGSFTFTPVDGYSGSTVFDYSFEDPRTGQTVTGRADLTVAAVADPVLVAGNATGDEDTAIALPMTIDLQDLDGSETLQSVVVAGVPAGATLAWNGALPGTVTPDGNGGFTFTGTEAEIRALLASLELTPPLNYSGQIALDIAVTSAEAFADPLVPGFGDSETVNFAYIVDVTPVADQPPVAVDATFTTAEDTPVAITGLVTSLVDADGSEVLTIEIEGVPPGATFDRGVDMGGGTWSFTPAEIAAGLTFTPPTNEFGTFPMSVAVISTETANGDAAPNFASFEVTVTPVVDPVDVASSGPAAGPEDTAILFGDKIGITINDPDGSEILTRVEIAGVPTGGSLGWTPTAGGSIAGSGGGVYVISGTEAAIRSMLASMTLTPPLHDADDVTLTISVTTQDGGPAGPTVTEVITQEIAVEPVADVPTSVGGTFVTEEDTAIGLTGVTGALADTDGSETATYFLDSVPAGASFGGAGTDLGGGVWQFTPAEIAGGLTFTPPPHRNGTFDMTLRVVATEGENADTETSTALVRVVVDHQADAPVVTSSPATGVEDTAIVFGHLVSIAPVDADGSESLQSVRISGLPAGGQLVWTTGLPGTVTGSGPGPYTITGSEAEIRALLATFAYQPPLHGDANVTLSITATQVDGDGSTAATTISQPIVVEADADQPTGSGSGSGTEDTAIAVPISVALADTDGSETISQVDVTGVPAGATIGWGSSAGTVTAIAGGFRVTGTTADIQARLASLAITPPLHSDQDFSLSVSVRAQESDPTNGEIFDEFEDFSFSVPVTVNADADQPSAVGGSYTTEEDTPVALAGIGGALVDGDGSESLSFRITGVPAGASFGGAGTDLGGGVWSFTPAEIAGGITFTPPSHAHGTYNMTLVSTATEAENADTATNSAPIIVVVDAQADQPTVTSSPATGVEDTDIVFGNGVTITLADADGSERLSSVAISGLPSGATLAWNTGLPGTVTGSGSGPYTITGSEAEIRGLLATLAYHPPLNGDGNVTLSIAATTTDADGSTATRTISQGIEVQADADVPTGSGAGAGLEDAFIAVPITVDLADTDGSETWQSVTVAGMPTDVASGGAVFRLVSGGGTQLFSARFTGSFPTTDGSGNAYTISGDGAGNLTFTGSTAGIEAALASLQIQRGLHIGDDFSLTVTATAVESNPTDSGMFDPTEGTSFTVNVVVNADADQPTAIGGSYTTEEDAAVALAGIGGALVDGDGSESLSFRITGVPTGATFSAGTDLGGGAWSFTPAEIAAGIAFTPPPNQHGTFNMTLVSTATEAENADAATNTAPIVVVVDAQVDGVTPAAATATGNEDQPINFGAGITWAHQDADGSEAVTRVQITSVPVGWAVTYTPTGASAVVTPSAGGFTITGTEADIRATLDTFAIQAPQHRDEDTSLSIIVTTRDADGSTTTANVVQPIVVNAVADQPSATGGSYTTNEDTSVLLTGLAGALVDTDGSETLAFRISGVPSGASFTTGTNLGGGVWSFTPVQLAAGLRFNPVAQFHGTVNMTLTSTATEHTVSGENLADDVATRTAPITVTVNPVLDVPVINGTSSTVNEDTQFNLGSNINVTLADQDGSQSMTVRLTSLPAGSSSTWTNQTGVTVTAIAGGYQITGANAATVLTVLNSFRLRPATNADANFTVGVQVTTTESGGATTTVNGTHNVVVRAVADRPTVSISGTGNEDTFIATPVTVNLVDTDGSETINQVVISGVPVDASGSGSQIRLVDGAGTITLAVNFSGNRNLTDALGNSYRVTGNGAGQLTFTGSSTGIRNGVASLAIKRGDHIGTDFTLSVVATARESNPTTPGGEVQTLNASNVAVTYTVNVIPITDTVTANAPATLSTEEDVGIRLSTAGFGATQVDADGSETLSYRFSSLPAGATFVDGSGAAIGTNLGGGVWTLTAAQLANAYFRAPQHQYGPYTFNFTAITNESEGTSSQSTDTKSVTVTVAPDPDAPTVSGSTTVTEDQIVNFGQNIAYSLVDTDGSEQIVEVQISNIPAGWTVSFSSGSMPSNVALAAGVYTITGTQTAIRNAVDTFRIQPPLNADGNTNPAVPDAQITVRVTTEDDHDSLFNNGDRATTTVTHDLTIRADADAPIAVTADADGVEDTTFALWPAGTGVNAALVDADGSETLSAALTGIPATWTVSASAGGGGTFARAGDGSIAITGTQVQINAILDSIQVRAPLHYSGILANVELRVTATEGANGTEVANKTATTVAAFDITVAADADTPTVSVVQATAGNAGYEDTPIKLTFTSQLVDRDGSEVLAHEVRGLPAGAQFTNAAGVPIGTNMGSGVWRFSAAEVAQLHVLPERDSNVDFMLEVRAIAIEGNTNPLSLPGANDEAASAWTPLAVEVIGVADLVTPVVVATTSPEDTRFPLGLAISGALADVDIPQEGVNSESLYFVITGLPSSIVPTNATYIGIGWQVPASAIASVTVPVPADFSGDYLTLAPGLAVRAVTQENDGDQTYGEVAFAPGQLIVSPVADGFSTWTPDAQVTEDSAIGLSGIADHAFSDADGSESVVSYTLDLNGLIADAGIGARLAELYGPGAGLNEFIANGIAGTFTNNGDGTITFTPAQLAGLSFRANVFLDSNDDFALPVTAIVRDTASALTNDRVETRTFTVDLIGDADRPTAFALPNYTGMSGTLVALNPGGNDIGGVSTDRDAALGRPLSENAGTGGDLYYTISNLDPAMALVDASGNPIGQNNNDGSWVLSPADLASLQVTSQPGFTGTRTLYITTTVIENDGDRASATASFDVTFTVNTGGGGASVAPLPPIVTIGPATGSEDGALALNIQVDFDPAERLDLNPRIALVFSDIPTGFTIQGATFNPANGKWVASEAAVEAGSVRLVPPADFSGPLPTGLTVEATISNSHFRSNTSGEIVIDGTPGHPLPVWDPVADGPAITLTHGAAVEDQPIALNISIAPRDGDVSSPETALYPVLVRVPTGYTLSAGVPTGTPGEYALTQAQLSGLTLLPPAVPSHEHTTPVAITVVASANEPGAAATTTQAFSIALVADADAPLAAAANAVGTEDAAISLAGLSAALVDTDGSELLSVKISGIPVGSILSAGGNNGDGSWTIPVGALSSLTITPPKDWSGVMNLSLDVFALETSNGDVALTSLPFTVTVTGTADRVSLDPQPLTMAEDATAPLNLSLRLEDGTVTPEMVEITFSGVPPGSMLSTGLGGTLIELGGGSWRFTGSETESNALQFAPVHAGGDYTIGLSVVTIDGASRSAALISSVPVSVTPVADVPSLTVNSTAGATGSAIPLNIYTSFPDTDGSETHQVQISGVPAGASFSAGTDLGGNVWQFTSAQLAGLTINVPALTPSFTLGVTATATEAANGSTATANGTVNVTIGSTGVTITGTSTGETLTGGTGGDTLNGLGGDDTLLGAGGADTLRGGTGADTMQGNAGVDTFIWASGDVGAGLDQIIGFGAGAGGDRIDLSAVLSGYVEGVSSVNDFVQLNVSAGNTTVRVDANGATGGAAFTDVVVLQGVTGLDVNTMKANANLIV